MEEIWLPVLGYIGLYEISNWGRVKSLNYRHTGQERILKISKDKDGYMQVDLYKNGKMKTHRVHRLVALAFIPNTENLPQVNHKNEQKDQNFVWVNLDGSIDESRSNLEWCTQEYNHNFGTINERIAAARTNGKMSKPVEQLTLDGQLVRTWPSTAEARRNGFDSGHISACCRKCYMRAGNNIYKGYIWRYHLESD